MAERRPSSLGAYIGIILSVSRFGANMGNEEEEEELAADENPVGIEPDTDGHPIESGLHPLKTESKP